MSLLRDISELTRRFEESLERGDKKAALHIKLQIEDKQDEKH